MHENRNISATGHHDFYVPFWQKERPRTSFNIDIPPDVDMFTPAFCGLSR